MERKRDPLLHSIKDIVCKNTGMDAADLLSDRQQYSIENLEFAASMILDEVKKGRIFRIVGDYDVDGVMASAILSLTFQELKAKFTVRLPKRFSEGYGLRPEIVEEFNPGDFLITVDNGIAAMDAVKIAKEKGMAVIIIDHHLAAVDDMTGQPVYPQADFIIDPNAIPDSADFNGYCGAGLAYRLSLRLLQGKEKKEHPLIPKLKSFAAIATVADSVPLIRENRRIVKEGFKTILDRQGSTKGLFALLCALDVREYMSEDIIGYKIAPVLNAPGRLRDDGAMDAFRFMVFDGSYEDAKKMAEKILEDNVTRRFLSDKWTEHAINEIAFGDMEYEHPLTLYLPGIPEGIIGIVAGRLAEYFKTPCFLLGDTRNPEWIKGSGRSYGKVHLKELLDRNKKYLVKYGGHAFAAGLTVKARHFHTFKQALQESLKEESIAENDEDYFDLEISQKQIEATLEEIEKYGPYGEGNPQILIKITDLTLISSGGSNYYKTFFRGRGVKLFSWKIEAINYNGRKEYEALGTPRHVSLLGVMSRSCYMGKFRNQIEYHKISANKPVQSKSPLALRLADQAQCRYEKQVSTSLH